MTTLRPFCVSIIWYGALSSAFAQQMAVFKDEARILFQGDSITDGNRGRTADPNHILGHGYQFIVSAKFGALYPERRLIFLNRGISGNTVADLAARWQNDAIALAPDVLSILIGINDMSRGVPVDTYEEQLDRLRADTVEKLPNVKLVLGEPFGLRSDTSKMSAGTSGSPICTSARTR